MRNYLINLKKKIIWLKGSTNLLGVKLNKELKLNTPFVVKESDLPLDVIFNHDINQIKMEEQRMRQKPKPITFYINSKEEWQSLREEVKFIIEGGGKAIQTSFVRKNEEEFFEFMNDFSNPHQIKNPKRLSSIKEQNIIASVWRRRKTIKSPMIKTPQDFGKLYIFYL